MEEKQVKSTEKIPSNNAVTINSWITSFLSNQVVDKILAFIAMLPFLFYVYRILIWGTVDIVRICIIIQHLLLVITMLFRRSPMRVTTQPLYWLLTFVATYWLWLTVTFTTSGTAIIPHWLSVALALVGLSITVYARVSLGRNIGLVPAQRLLVTTGAYRLVRHPIYTGMFINYLSFALADYSPSKAAIAGLGVLWFILKSFIEERFLSEDPEYVEYMEIVRWRWIPWII